MKTEIVNLTKKLIKVESIKSKPEKLQEVINVATNYFKGTKLIIKKYQSKEKPSIMVLSHNTKHPKLILNGHLDVIEAEKDQFSPKIEGDKLVARGAGDMKGACATMMVVAKKLFLQNPKLSFGLMLTTDEEIGGFDGVKYLLNKEKYTADIAFIPDGGRNFEIIVEEKGILHFALETKGVACHASRPYLGKSAIDELITACYKLRKAFINPKNPNEWKISFNIGKIAGGEASNKVADYAKAECDIRYPAKYTRKGLYTKIKKVTGITPKAQMDGDPFFTKANNPYLKIYKEISEKILKRKVEITKYPAASDARFFTPKKIPVILTEPVGENHHGKNEYVTISSLEKLAQILEAFIPQVN